MADPQTTLLAVPPTAPSTRRTTSKGIGAGDIVEIDKRGRRFHALVMELEQLDTGRFELVVHRAGAHDEPGGAGAGAPPIDGVVSGGDHRRVVGEPEVVVRRERDQTVGCGGVERAR